MKSLITPLLLFVTLFANHVPQCWGQLPPQQKTTSQKPLSFEVVSIKPWNPASPVYPGVARTSDGYRTTGQQLVRTIVLAYFRQLNNGTMSTTQVTGGPGWLTDQYDIDARVSEPDITQWQKQGFRPENEPMLLEMLRVMLIERFNLRAHLVQTETDGFKLKLAKSAPKLAPGTPFNPATEKGRINRTFDDGGELVMVPDAHPRSDGMTEMHPAFYNASMADLAEWLSSIAPMFCQDATGLTGRYDFAFAWPDLANGIQNDGGPRPFFYYQGLAKLGLKADSGKVSMKKLVIDHIERPTPN